MNDWKKVFTTLSILEATVLRSILEDNEIPAVIMDKRDSAYPVFGTSFGQVELYTKQDYIVEALALIKKSIEK